MPYYATPRRTQKWLEVAFRAATSQDALTAIRGNVAAARLLLLTSMPR